MRKLTLSLLAISFFIFTLCGCENVNSFSVMDTFCVNAQVKQNDLTFNCVVERQSNTDLSVKITEDDNTNGLTYHYVNDTLYIEFEGLKCITNTDYLKGNCAVSIIYNVMSELENLQNYKCEKVEDTYIYTLKNDNVSALVSLDENSGQIVGIKVINTDCEIKFSNQNI